MAKKISKLYLKIFCLFNIFFAPTCFGQSPTNKSETYYMKTGTYPDDATNDWNPNSTETQGVTHDSKYWYFTSTGFYAYADVNGLPRVFQDCFLWKIPVDEDLNQNFKTNPRAKMVNLLQFTELANSDSIGGFVHWGDPDHFQYKGVEYLIIPATSSGRNGMPKVAAIIFRANNLSLVGYANLPGDISNNHKHPQKNIGWCAINPIDSNLYTSNDDPDIYVSTHLVVQGSSLFNYEVDWSVLDHSGDLGRIDNLINFFEIDTLWKSTPYGSGITYNALHNMQGGEFSPSGDLLYLSSGSGECYVGPFGGGNGVYESDGIHVFQTQNWHEIKTSINHARNQTGYFDYSFDNGCTCVSGSQTPEGLTIWDLDDGRAPNITGQLHVLINFYNQYAVCDDALALQHFGGKIYVDEIAQLPPAWTNQPSGSKTRPFFTVSDVFTWSQVWDGAEVVVKAGSYIDTGYYTAKIKFTSQGGNATIGNSKTTTKGVVLYQHPDYKGDYRYFTKDVPDLDLGTINFADVTSSLRVYNIQKVILYDGHNYTGASYTVTKDTPDVTPFGWNDRVGSLKIIR